MSDASLLKLRLCDLPLSLDAIDPAIGRLYAELQQKGLKFRPHVWLSHGFFAEDSLAGFAVPFYLAHPRLMELERHMMLDVEAGTFDWLLRIFRHEAGHAMDNALKLHRRAAYKRLFGDFKAPYPDTYRPDVASKHFVLHLDCWYAQSHPAEDFAETFAVWMSPTSDWRRAYRSWPAIEKLRWVDEVMRKLVGEPIPKPPRGTHKPLKQLTVTLEEHYAERRRAYQQAAPSLPLRDIRRLFTDRGRRSLAAPLVLRWKPSTRLTVSRWTGLPQLTLERTFDDLLRECRQRQLRLTRPAGQTQRDLIALLTAHTQTFLADARHPIPL